jgi:hypothetical protein
MKSSLAAFGLVLGLIACPAGAAIDVESPQGLLKGQVPDNAAALKRVAITTFFVQYVTDFGIESKGTKAFRNQGDLFYSKWKDVPPEVLQATTNALYEQLAADLKAAGIDVVPNDQVAALAPMAELRKVGRANPARVSDSTLRKASSLVSAKDLPLVLATVPDVKLSSYATQPIEGTDPPRNLIGWDKQASEWLLGSNFELMSLTTIYFGQAKVAESLNATALNVRLTVPLVDMGTSSKLGGVLGGSSLFASSAAIGHVKANPRFVEAGTVFSFAQAGGNPGHRHVVGLQKPVQIAGLTVTPDKETKAVSETALVRSDDDKTARSGGLLGAIMGAAGAQSDQSDFWVTVDAAGFQPALVAAGSAIFKELAQILAAKR